MAHHPAGWSLSPGGGFESIKHMRPGGRLGMGGGGGELTLEGKGKVPRIRELRGEKLTLF